MAFSPIVDIGQSISNPAAVVFTDSSTGSDSDIDSRRIYITDSQGNYVVPSGTTTDYISWPLATNPMTVSDLLTQDIAANILVQWLDSSEGVLYETDDDYALREFNIQFFIYLIQNQGLNPGVVQDTTYFSNLATYWVNIIGAENMIVYADDLAGAQNCLNRATNMMNNQSDFF